ncbi:D-alanyl-D-alanine carboxypeptidase [Streptomyces sp. NPDC047525]|uniref:D-alanyl-D-alanine carboxypeptidase n=1 Tax=Streptomyces sp. NPDC047525 TaxID=3155264 RepID=UPI0033EE126D
MFWRNGNASGMAYEEASVAGETPDRSKQRKSSGKPTGSEPSVPAPEERDPRLAVAREVPAAREETRDEVRDEVRQDKATAVFSTKAVAEAAEASGSKDAEGSAEGSSEAAEAEAEPKGEEKGDARLRAAVAAWVASADEEGPEAAEGEKSAQEAAAADEEAASGEDAASAEDATADDSEADEEDSSDDSEAADDGDGDGDGDSEAEAAAAAEPEPEPEAAASESDAADEAPADDEADASEDSEPADAADSTDSTEDDADADEDETKAEAEVEDETPEPPSGGVDQATAVFKALPPKAVDQPTTMLKLSDHKPEAKKPEAKKPEAKDAAKPEAKVADKADDKPADKAEARPAAKPTAKPSAKPEGEAERTSKFVALKPLDNASSSGALPPAKAAPAAGAAAGAATSEKAPTPETAPTPEKGNVGPERTTQQPLPPRPPLDLLAELTNTPPPPETRVRTTVRRVKIWTPLVLLMVVVFAVVQAVRPLPTPTLTLTAKETVSFEGDKPSMPWPSQGEAAMDVNGIGTFGTSGSQKPVPIASIAKVMTVYLILRDHPLKKGGDNGPDIPVDAAAAKHYETGKADNESVVKVTEGQKISEYEALQAVMLPSANNIAKLLARWDTKSDSEDEFVAKMNKTAKELGMKNTHYTDPSGLDKTTVSTAEDLVKLGRAAMEDPVFNEISRQPSYKDLNGDKQNNFFGLVPTVAIGIKTGTTTAAGGNILFAAEKKIGGETRTIIGAALGQYGQNGVANIDEVTKVTRTLIEAGQEALIAKKIVKKGDVVGEVDDGLGGTTPVVATKDVTAAGWSGLTVKLKLGEDGGETIPHSAKAGTKVGVLSVGDGKDGAVEVPVALQKDLSEPGFGAKLKRVG